MTRSTRTAISNARIRDLDQTHVTFRWKDREAQAWRTQRLPGVEFLGRFLQHVLPQGFHRVRYYGVWHPSKRGLARRAWVLLALETPADAAESARLPDILEALGQETGDFVLASAPGDEPPECPRCPHCGSTRTRLLGEYPRGGVP